MSFTKLTLVIAVVSLLSASSCVAATGASYRKLLARGAPGKPLAASPSPSPSPASDAGLAVQSLQGPADTLPLILQPVGSQLQPSVGPQALKGKNTPAKKEEEPQKKQEDATKRQEVRPATSGLFTDDFFGPRSSLNGNNGGQKDKNGNGNQGNKENKKQGSEEAPFDLPSAFQTKSTTPADNPKPAITLPLERKPGEVQPKEVKREESNRGEEKKRDGNTADILKSIQVGDKGKAETKDGKKEDSRKDKGKDQKKQEGDKVADKALPVAPEAITTRLQNVFTKPTDNTDAAAMAAAVITSAGSKGRKSDEVQAAASSIVEVFSKGNTNNRGDTIAEAFAFSAARDATATATVFARAAVDARRRGYERDFGKQCSRGFVKARSRGSLEDYTSAVSRAIIDEDNDDVVQVYGVAFAEAIAAGGEEGSALAEATALAFCKGGSSATAFAKAYSVALERNKNGCLVLTEAKAVAVARCKDGWVKAYAEASVERKVLGFCGILEQFGVSFDVFGRRR